MQSEFTHKVVRTTSYYLQGPQQGSDPDGTLPVGERVRDLGDPTGEYLRVATESEMECYVDQDDLEAIT